jgi:hypothetical protein
MNLTAALTVYRSPARVEGISLVLVDEARGRMSTILDTRALPIRLWPEAEALRDALQELRESEGDAMDVLAAVRAAFAVVDSVAPGVVIAVRACDADAAVDLPNAAAIRHQHRAWTIIEFLRAAVT